jgi:peptidoglycan/xylan/chitin deacetylase (PgdA/CDA1 family)
MARSTVAALGLQLIQWDVVTGDPAPNVSARAIVRTILSHAQNGSIVIMHMNGRGWHTAAALPVVIAQLRARGYSLVTISGLLG